MAQTVASGSLGANVRSWAAAAVTIVLALASSALFADRHGLSWPTNPAWLLLLPAFLIAERTEIHFEFRKQTVSWSLNEIPSVVGLFVFGVEATAVTRAVAITAALLVARYPAPKLVFNVAVAVFEVTMAGLLLQALNLTNLSEPVTWLALIGSLLAAGVLGITCIAGAIRLTQGALSATFWSALALPQMVLGPLASTAGVVVLLLVNATPWALVLAVGLLGLFVLLYRRYAAAAQDRRSLAEVYEFSERVQNTGNDKEGELAILAAVREKFNASRAALWIPSHLDQGPRTLAVSEDGAASYPGPDYPDDAIRLETIAGGRSRLVVQGPGSSARELTALRRRGVKELIGVPLEMATDQPGYLEVCDRNGSVLAFSPTDVELMQSLATHVAAALGARQLLDKIRYDAAHDPVTDLPNRFWLAATINAHLDVDPKPRRLALLVAEIDGFAQVNETLGHAAGDELLRAIAVALAEHAAPDAQVTRLAGAQFAVVLPETDVIRAEAEASRLTRDLPSRVPVAGLELTAGLAFGVAVAPGHGDSAGLLLQHADVAVLAARAGGMSTATYSPAMDNGSLRRLRLAADLADAVETSQISVVFQPIVGTATGEIVAVELLSRWTHPDLGPVTPDEFIPLAERIGQITPLTRRVLRTALRRGQAWLDDGIAISVAVNLSTVSLIEPGFVDDVAETLREHAFPAELLIFEITEGRVVGEALALPALEQLHGLGVRLSVDDFGTGYSSLSYLPRLPVDEVKIDKSFVKDMSTDRGTNLIVGSIIELSHGMGFRVVAEGVEDEVSRQLLTDMRCDFLQGYLISRPLTERNLLAWLAAGTAAAPAGQDEDEGRRKLYIRG